MGVILSTLQNLIETQVRITWQNLLSGKAFINILNNISGAIYNPGTVVVSPSATVPILWEGTTTPDLQVQDSGTGGINAALGIARWQSATTAGPKIYFGKSRSDTPEAFTIVQSDDAIGRIIFTGADGNVFQNGAEFRAEVDGTPSSVSMPGRLILSTTPSGSVATVERVRIDNAGNVGIGKTPSVTLDVNGIIQSNTLVGYGPSGSGVGGSITQLTSKSAPVTLNTVSGQVITSNSTLLPNTTAGFIVHNSVMAAADVVVLNLASGQSNALDYEYNIIRTSSGSFTIYMNNVSAATLAEALAFSFIILKGVDS